MGTFKETGIVLRETESKDYDKTITVLTEGRGKLYLYVRGAKKPKSKLSSGTEIFSLSEFMIFDGSGFFSLTQVDLLDGFYGLRSNYDIFCRACFMAEVTEKIMQPQMDSSAVLGLMREAFSAFCKNSINADFVFIVFMLKLLRLEGYMPELEVCSRCGKEYDNFSHFCDTGVLCDACLLISGPNDHIRINTGIAAALKHIFAADSEKLFGMNTSDTMLSELRMATDFFLERNLDISLKSKGFV